MFFDLSLVAPESKADLWLFNVEGPVSNRTVLMKSGPAVKCKYFAGYSTKREMRPFRFNL